MKLRKARNTDVPQIRNLINGMALRTDEDYKHGHMLARSLTELYEHIRDYTVLVDVDEASSEERVVGCCALESQWDGLAELKAMAIADEVQGQGWGRALVDAVLSECDAMGLSCVYLLTNKMEFFARLGFEPIDMRKLPMRVWSECTNCPKFMVACDEVAMTYQGQQPRQAFIPAVGAQASPAARAALGVLPVINSTSSPDALNGLRAADAQNGNASNGSRNGDQNGSSNHTDGRSGGPMNGGPMNSDGYSPPFRPHPEE